MMKEEKLSYYLNKAKIIEPNSSEKEIKIAILGSFTLNGLEEVLQVKCAESNIRLISYVGEYNQYNQDILNPESSLHQFHPDVTFLILDVRTILGDAYYFPYSNSSLERKKTIDEIFSELKNLIQYFKQNLKSKLIITNFNIPTYSPFGIYENKTKFNFKKMIMELNNLLENFIQEENSIFLYDFDGFIRKFGESHVFNYRQYFFGDVKIGIDYLPHLGYELMGYVKPILGLSKKCIVVDLDNTMWGGVIGEDGFDGIKLGPYIQGRPFLEFQKILLALNKRGIILAINSKNNYDDAIKVIREHPHMLIKEENFSSIQINWNDKVSNIQEIAHELNIGLDSIVYFDDDPINRELMKTSLPQVLTIDLPRDPSEYCLCVTDLNDFNLLQITEDDIKRSRMYNEEHQRKKFQKNIPNLENFLQKMNIEVIIKNGTDFTIPRISQLTLKTNQFNLTTKRYQEEEIKSMVNDKKFLVEYAQVLDKFGDNGITGVCIVKKNDTEWIIDTFLLSCRVMGRGVEEGILGHILEQAKKEGISKVIGEYIPTTKNNPCSNFYQKYGFERDGKNWSFNLKNSITIPNHLKVRNDE